MKHTHDYLVDLLDYVSDIESFTQPGEDHFMEDRKTQLAVIRAYEVIGEIVKRIPQPLLDAQPNVDWKAIKGFRDVLIHQYDNVDLKIVWGAVQQIRLLREAVESMLAGLNNEDQS